MSPGHHQIFLAPPSLFVEFNPDSAAPAGGRFRPNRKSSEGDDNNYSGYLIRNSSSKVSYISWPELSCDTPPNNLKVTPKKGTKATDMDAGSADQESLPHLTKVLLPPQIPGPQVYLVVPPASFSSFFQSRGSQPQQLLMFGPDNSLPWVGCAVPCRALLHAKSLPTRCHPVVTIKNVSRRCLMSCAEQCG